jgi:hypothetical protein
MGAATGAAEAGAATGVGAAASETVILGLTLPQLLVIGVVVVVLVVVGGWLWAALNQGSHAATVATPTLRASAHTQAVRGLAGDWNTEFGVFHVAATGTNAYDIIPAEGDFGVASSGCVMTAHNATAHGQGVHLNGTWPYFDQDTCAFEADGQITIDMGPDGNSATVTFLSPPNSPCSQCTYQEHWTRISA